MKHPTEANLENIKILRAKARRIIRKAKRDSWRAYISKLTASTPAKKVWEMLKRISGKSAPGTARHLVVDDGKRIEHPKDIANTIGSTLSYNSSSENLPKSFQKIKTQQEKIPLRFQSDNSEPYNHPFSKTELKNHYA